MYQGHMASLPQEVPAHRVEDPRTETGSPQYPVLTSCVHPCPRRRMCKVCVSIIKMKWSFTPLEPGSSAICCLVHTEREPKVSGSVFLSLTPSSWGDGVGKGNIARIFSSLSSSQACSDPSETRKPTPTAASRGHSP